MISEEGVVVAVSGHEESASHPPSLDKSSLGSEGSKSISRQQVETSCGFCFHGAKHSPSGCP